MESAEGMIRLENGTNHGFQLGNNFAPITNYFNSQAPTGSRTVWLQDNVHFMVPRPVNTLFTGRNSILDRIRNTVTRSLAEDNHVQCRVVITGIGGQGKSEVCLHLVNDMRQRFWGVFWVDVSEASQVEASFIAIAEQLQRSTRDLQEAKYVLSNVSFPWLLVLDNADDPDVDYQEYIPAGNQGCILITSRNDECCRYGTAGHERLPALDDTEAQKLLLKAAQVSWSPDAARDADTICALLNSHPLALIQAGSYVAQNCCTLADYPRVFERYRRRVLSFHPKQAKSRYKDVYATFKAAMDVLQRPSSVSNDARELLSLLSALDWSPLPIAIFEAAWSGGRRIIERESYEFADELLEPEHLQQLASAVELHQAGWNSFRLMDALRLLRSLALISVSTIDPCHTISIHPLIHSWARDMQEPRANSRSWIAGACLIALSRQHDELWRLHQEHLRPHLLAICGRKAEVMFHEQSPKLVGALLYRCALQLNTMRIDQKLASMLSNVFDHLKLSPVLVHKDWLVLYKLRAISLYHIGSLNESTHIRQQIFNVHSEELAVDHPVRLASQVALGWLYMLNRQARLAVEILEEMVLVESRSLEEDHPRRLQSQAVLAIAYSYADQNEKAVGILERVVAIGNERLGEDHRRHLSAQYWLARMYIKDKKYLQGIKILARVIEIDGRSVEEDHPRQLASQELLASAYTGAGQHEKAIEILERVVEAGGRRLGDDHPDHLATQESLADAYSKVNQIGKSVTILERVVENGNLRLGEDEVGQRDAQYRLARAYLINEQVQQAIEMFERVVRIEQRCLESTDPKRMSSQRGLAMALWNGGYHRRALDLAELLVEVLKIHPNPDDPDHEKFRNDLRFYRREFQEIYVS